MFIPPYTTKLLSTKKRFKFFAQHHHSFHHHQDIAITYTYNLDSNIICYYFFVVTSLPSPLYAYFVYCCLLRLFYKNVIIERVTRLSTQMIMIM